MIKLSDIKYDWVTSIFYKKKEMSKWAEEYIKNNGNDIDIESLKKEVDDLIIQDNLIGLNSFNMYGSFEMLWSSIPNALVTQLIKFKNININS